MGFTPLRLFLLFCFFATVAYWITGRTTAPEQIVRNPGKIYSTSSSKGRIAAKKARMDYFLRMLRDPVTGTIPHGIRDKELAFARALPKRLGVLSKTTGITDGTPFVWQEAGPTDVGGRTPRWR
ncbi:MAG: hypothetical protein FJY97_00255 [candidate division Zixibacteria bacterium]|nr:hypothetical protein [candidate division Zixibacteria bacterium]